MFQEERKSTYPQVTSPDPAGIMLALHWRPRLGDLAISAQPARGAERRPASERSTANAGNPAGLGLEYTAATRKDPGVDRFINVPLRFMSQKNIREKSVG